jgi:hypothetical protein
MARPATLVASVFVVVLAGCARRTPPIGHFAVTFESGGPPGKPHPEPPEATLRPWRVWVDQERPRQKKNPEWRSFGAKDGALLDMAPDGKWACLVNPVTLLGTIGEKAKIVGWVASRTIRCSSDGWKTSTDARVRAGFDTEGKPTELDPSAVLYLNDVVGGTERMTVVVLEGEKVTRTN